jgi:hypothetical protein
MQSIMVNLLIVALIPLKLRGTNQGRGNRFVSSKMFRRTVVLNQLPVQLVSWNLPRL